MICFPKLYRKLDRKMSSVQKRLFARQLRKDTGNRTIHNNDEPSVAIQKAKSYVSKPRTAKRKTSNAHHSSRYRQRHHSSVDTTRQLVNLIAMALLVAGCSWLMPKSRSYSGSKSGPKSGSKRLMPESSRSAPSGSCRLPGLNRGKPKITLYDDQTTIPENIMKMATEFRNYTFVKQSGNAQCLMYAINNVIFPFYKAATVEKFDYIQNELAQDAKDIMGGECPDVEPQQGGYYSIDVLNKYFANNNIKYDRYEPKDYSQILTTLNDDGVFGFIMHSGSLTSGHYVALRKLTDNWYIFADSLDTIMLIDKMSVPTFIMAQNYTSIIRVIIN